MKNIFLYILFLSFVGSYSQQQASNWYFGENAGIQFDTNSGTVNSVDGGQLFTREGCSSISDIDGNLLFYTDGSTVYTSVHTVMRNGSGLLGDESSTQSAIVIPKPGDPDIYYIFTVGSNQTANGMKYSVVDMTMDGGLGQVTIKNVNLLNQCAEKIAAVLQDCTTGNIWVIALADENGASSASFNTIHAFEVTNGGVNSTSVESIFPRLGITDSRGYLKLSPDGTKLACANVQSGLYIFDFDTATGRASNESSLRINGANNKPYGLEFSPNGQVLYVSATNDNFGGDSGDPSSHFSTLVQYDLTSGDLNASQFVVDDRSLFRGGMQLGPDGAIYRALSATYNTGLPFLGRINNPNIVGVGCDYEHNAIDLGNNDSTQGLPPFIASFFTEKIDIIRNGDTSTTFLPLCTGDIYTLTADDIPGAIYTWTFEGNPVADSDYDLVVVQGGTYELTIELNNGDCEVLEGEAIVEYFDIPIANPTSNVLICDDNNDSFWEFDFSIVDATILDTQDAAIFSVHYFPTQVDADNNENEITGIYTNTNTSEDIYVRIHNDGNPNCFDTTQFSLEVFNSPTANNVDSFITCDDDVDGDNSNGQIEINLNDFNAIVMDTQNPLEFSVTYHSSQSDADLGNSDLPFLYYNLTAFQETIYVRVENNFNTECFDTTFFDVIVNPIPEPFDSTLIQCDEDGTVDGFTSFNLNQAYDDLTGGVAGLSVKYHTSLVDAQNDDNEVNGDAFFNWQNPQLIYTQIIVDDTGCSSIAILTLEVSTTQIDDYQADPVCDELGSEDGINTFDLNIFSTDIQTLNAITFPITYYETYDDALLEQNELATPYSNISPYSQVIYARAEDDNACYGISEVQLTINVLPQLEEDETVFYCLNTYPETITLEAGILNDNPNNYTYSWSSGEMNNEIQINQIGNYTVTATNTFGCSKTRTITVEASNIATINSVEVIDGMINNTITVSASGEGEYVYALLNDEGPYTNFQTSNIFTNVYPGIYTIAVRDIKNDCGIVEQLVSVIGFPQYFTPNNDGYHDTWQVLGISEQIQPNTNILIFDRYGKLLKQLSPLGLGWDGTFNGNNLPVDDYWFSVKLQDGRIYKNHFTLKR